MSRTARASSAASTGSAAARAAAFCPGLNKKKESCGWMRRACRGGTG